MGDLDLQSIIQGGAVGVLVLVVVLNFLKDKLYNKTLNNHLDHIDTSLRENAKQQERANANHENMVRILDKTGEIMNEVKGVITKCNHR